MGVKHGPQRGLLRARKQNRNLDFFKSLLERRAKEHAEASSEGEGWKIPTRLYPWLKASWASNVKAGQG